MRKEQHNEFEVKGHSVTVLCVMAGSPLLSNSDMRVCYLKQSLDTGHKNIKVICILINSAI